MTARRHSARPGATDPGHPRPPGSLRWGGGDKGLVRRTGGGPSYCPDFSRERHATPCPRQTLQGSLMPLALPAAVAPCIRFEPVQADLLLDEGTTLSPLRSGCPTCHWCLAMHGVTGRRDRRRRHCDRGFLFVNYAVPSQPILPLRPPRLAAKLRACPGAQAAHRPMSATAIRFRGAKLTISIRPATSSAGGCANHTRGDNDVEGLKVFLSTFGPTLCRRAG